MSNPHLRFHSSTVALLAATVVALLLLVHPRAEASLDWQPTRTWVFVVGTLEWENAEALPPFPKDKRRDLQLVNFFKKAGVADDQIIYLQDQEATLATIQDQLNDFLPKASEGDLLIVYYCGHGYPSGDDPKRIIMASYDASPDEEGWSYEALVKAIERHFKGDRALIISDCCHAGGAIGAAKRNGKRVSYSTLGSSTFSQESTANWTYTESVLAAFRGSPAVDLDSDGWITLGETQQFARREMRFAEDQDTSWLIGKSWGREFVLAKAKPRTHRRIGAHAKVKADGEWWKARVTAVRDDEFKVFYYGYEQSDSQWVKEENMRWHEQTLPPSKTERSAPPLEEERSERMHPKEQKRLRPAPRKKE